MEGSKLHMSAYYAEVSESGRKITSQQLEIEDVNVDLTKSWKICRNDQEGGDES